MSLRPEGPQCTGIPVTTFLERRGHSSTSLAAAKLLRQEEPHPGATSLRQRNHGCSSSRVLEPARTSEYRYSSSHFLSPGRTTGVLAVVSLREQDLRVQVFQQPCPCARKDQVMVSCPTATVGVGCHSYRATSSASNLLPAPSPSPPRHSACSSRDTAASAPAHETKNNVLPDDFSSTRRRSRQKSTKRAVEFYSAR